MFFRRIQYLLTSSCLSLRRRNVVLTLCNIVLCFPVKIPKDAYVMDFVFSERGDDRGGIYDNRNGLDYHVPVKGGLLSQPPLDIIHIAVEMAPIAKVCIFGTPPT